MDADPRPPALPGLESWDQVGRGASGSVWKAWQPRFTRWVAVKVVHETPNAVSAERFSRECQALGGLSGHPHIVTVLDAGQLNDGRPFLTMPFLAGGSYADRLGVTGPLTPERTLDVAVKMCSALHAAHAAGVLHRDVKPENMLISNYGEPVLADFGVARLEMASLTRTGTFAATPLHAAPEVMAGKRATAASDVYGLGSSMFRLLRGQAAFVEETDESLFPLLNRIANDAPADLREHGVPDALAAVIELMMAKDPAARPASALEAGQALQQAQRTLTLPVTAAPGLGVSADDLAIPLEPIREVRELPTVDPSAAAASSGAPVQLDKPAAVPYAPPQQPAQQYPTGPPQAAPAQYGTVQPPPYGTQPPAYATQPPAYTTGPQQQYGAPPPYQPYGAPQGYPPYPPAPGSATNNPLAIASLILSIVWIFWLGSLLAIVFGHISLKQIKASGQGGRGLAIAGLIIGYLGMAFLAIGIIGLATGSSGSSG